jgi:6,7-dimethyl-8-ribityllumazine synthase
LASSQKNLDLHSARNLNKIIGKNMGVVVSEWNHEVTDALLSGCKEALKIWGCESKNLTICYVPGSFELILGAQKLAKREDVEAVICLGCVIQGETRHFDFICNAVANGISDVCLKYDKPVIFGVLTTDNQEQALDRSGGKHGNKGYEAGITAIKMLNAFN